MKNNRLKNLFNMQQAVCCFGLLAFAITGFLLLTKSAEMQSAQNVEEQFVSKTAGQPDALGKLAYGCVFFTFGGNPNAHICTANANGSGEMTLTGFPPPTNLEPTWSSDGTKIAYAAYFNSAEIFVMNADGSNKVNLTNTMSVDERNPSWSATGKIAYERAEQIWTMNADGSNQMPFSGISQLSATAPAWSFDGSKLAFVSGGEIWVINADGSNQRRVTNTPAEENHPAWSPDGAKIVYNKNPGSIFVINQDGTNETNLSNGSDDREPAWSSDGTIIAFVRKGANSGIYVMNVNGANQIRVIADSPTTPGRTENNSPAWQPTPTQPNTFTISGRVTRVGAGLAGVTVTLSGSVSATTVTDSFGNFRFDNLPAGGNYTVTPSLANHVFAPPSRAFNNLSASQIADFTATEICSTLSCATNGKIVFVRGSDIWTMNPDGSNQTPLTANSGFNIEPSYSPDGSKIVFASTRDGNREIYRMNADGSGTVRLTNNSAEEAFPSYSPDGGKIVFVSNRDGNKEIYTMNADGSAQTRLTQNTSDDDTPSYSPDSNVIIFVRLSNFRYDIYTMSANGSNQSNLTNQLGFYYQPSYSPDGSKIVFMYGQDVTSQAVYTMNADGSNRTLFTSGYQSPSYSPDGSKILMHSILLLQRGIFTANASGGGFARLTSDQDFSPKWQPLRQTSTRRVSFDFDGDRKTDISVFRPSNGYWYRLNSADNSFFAFQFGASGDRIAPADYDGDRKTDVAVWRETTPERAYFYIFNSSNNTFRAEQFGAAGDAPASGDWDGDGRDDLAVFRAAAAANQQSAFYYRPSSQAGADFVPVYWGTIGDKPIAADYDGDGRMDAAVFRPGNAVWYIRKSSDQQLISQQFGTATDTPTPADFDGDGRTNVAVFRSSTGWWYTSQNPATNYGGVQFGASGDIPVAADYDGDGRADVAVFRPSNGGWYLLRSQQGFAGVQFGVAEDKPAPSAFVPQ